MLETVVAEKLLPGSRPPPAVSPTVPQTPMRSNTLGTGERLRGLLSGRNSSFMDRALPNPNAGRAATPPISQGDGSRSPQPLALSPIPGSSGSIGFSNGQIGLGSQPSSIGASTVSLAGSALTEESSASPRPDVASNQSDSTTQGVANGGTPEADTAPPPPPKSDTGAN